MLKIPEKLVGCIVPHRDPSDATCLGCTDMYLELFRSGIVQYQTCLMAGSGIENTQHPMESLDVFCFL